MADTGLSRRVQSLPSFQAPHLFGVLKLLQTMRKMFSFACCLKMYHKIIIHDSGFCMMSNLLSSLSVEVEG